MCWQRDNPLEFVERTFLAEVPTLVLVRFFFLRAFYRHISVADRNGNVFCLKARKFRSDLDVAARFKDICRGSVAKWNPTFRRAPPVREGVTEEALEEAVNFFL